MIPRKIALFLLILLGCSIQAGAQILSSDKTLRPYHLELRDYPDGGGVRWAAGTGISESGPEHIGIDGLSPLQATEIHLLSLDPAEAVTMSLVKNSWDDEIFNCTTDQTAMCSFQFRTYGDVGVKVQGPEGARWQLVVMTSPKIEAASLLPSPFFEAHRADADRLQIRNNEPLAQSGGQSPGFETWLLFIAVILLVVIAGLLLLLVKKRHAVAIAPLAFLLLSGGWLEEGHAGFSSSTAGSLEALRAMAEANARTNQVNNAERAAVDSALAKLLERIKKIREIAELKDAYDPVAECDKIAEPPGAPRIPMFCEGNSECEACYASARASFNEARGTFEQLRVIYQCVMEDVKAKVAFGDSASGIHAVSGLAWQTQRIGIMKSVKGLKKAYDEKYAELRKSLHQSMIEMAECEARYGLPDWYDRFGFMYYEFMSDRYRRAD